MAGLALFSAACSAEGLEEESVTETTEAITHSPHTITGYRWTRGTNGWNSVAMTPVASSFCFLSGLLGAFTGSDDLVIIGSAGSSNWRLSGTPTSGGGASTGAEAFCVHGVTPSGGVYSWENQAPVDMGSATNRTCFLTSVWGNLAGPGEEVRTEIVSGRWRLNGNSAGGQAMCVNLPNWFPTALSNSSTGSKLFRDASNPSFVAHNLNSHTPWACGLTRVGGLFRSGGTVQIREIPNGGVFPEYDWYIGSTPNTFPNFLVPTGSGRCVQ